MARDPRYSTLSVAILQLGRLFPFVLSDEHEDVFIRRPELRARFTAVFAREIAEHIVVLAIQVEREEYAAALAGAGLTGSQLDLKLRVFEAAEEWFNQSWRHYRSAQDEYGHPRTRSQSGRLGQLRRTLRQALKPLLKIANEILGSLLAVPPLAGLVEPVKEFKGALEAALDIPVPT